MPVFDRHSTNVRSSVKVSRGHSAKSWDLRASVSFANSPLPLFRFIFALVPISADQTAKNATEMLATQETH